MRWDHPLLVAGFRTGLHTPTAPPRRRRPSTRDGVATPMPKDRSASHDSYGSCTAACRSAQPDQRRVSSSGVQLRERSLTEGHAKSPVGRITRWLRGDSASARPQIPDQSVVEGCAASTPSPQPPSLAAMRGGSQSSVYSSCNGSASSLFGTSLGRHWPGRPWPEELSSLERACGGAYFRARGWAPEELKVCCYLFVLASVGCVNAYAGFAIPYLWSVLLGAYMVVIATTAWWSVCHTAGAPPHRPRSRPQPSLHTTSRLAPEPRL